MDSPAWKETQVDFFHNFGYLLQPLELVPDLRKHVVPTEWQVRAVLGDWRSKAKVISIQAPQYRQHALTSDFLDLANLSIREAAALAMNWIKDRSEGLKIQNLPLATMTGQAMSSFPKIWLQMFSMSSTNASDWAQGNSWSVTGIHRQLHRFFHRTWQSFDVIFCRICTSSAVWFLKAPSVAILTSLRPAVNPLPGCSSGKPVQDKLAWGFVL